MTPITSQLTINWFRTGNIVLRETDLKLQRDISVTSDGNIAICNE